MESNYIVKIVEELKIGRRYDLLKFEDVFKYTFYFQDDKRNFNINKKNYI